MIATEISYDSPNIITIFKNGSTKVPLVKVGRLAKALEVDAVFLFKLALMEYAPVTLTAMDEILEMSILTVSERELIAAHRKATHGKDAPTVIAYARDVIAVVTV